MADRLSTLEKVPVRDNDPTYEVACGGGEACCRCCAVREAHQLPDAVRAIRGASTLATELKPEPDQ